MMLTPNACFPYEVLSMWEGMEHTALFLKQKPKHLILNIMSFATQETTARNTSQLCQISFMPSSDESFGNRLLAVSTESIWQETS